MDLRKFMDSTYLKTADQAGCSESENLRKVEALVQEAIDFNFKLAMIRPEYVSRARVLVDERDSAVLIGTVIDFPEGKSPLEAKLAAAVKALEDGADELDFVVDYNAFKRGEVAEVREQIYQCSQLVLKEGKLVKWIIEVAALTDLEIVQLTTLVKKVALSKFDERQYDKIMVKSSTGFFVTKDGKPNGATLESVILMLENASPLAVKAAGGIRTRKEALDLIALGVKRLGTSAAAELVENGSATDDY